MYRCGIYTTEEEVVFAMDTHHIISDGTMTANFAEALFAAYRGEPLKEALRLSITDLTMIFNSCMRALLRGRLS